MPDPRVTKLAQVLVQYSLNLQPGEELLIETSPLAEELNLAVYKEAILAGALVSMTYGSAGATELLLKYGNDDQIAYLPPHVMHAVKHFPAMLFIDAPANTRALSGIDPERMRLYAESSTEFSETMARRTATKELKWTLTVYPSHALAQEADMSLHDYEDFVYGAGLLDLPDPVAAWQEEAERQRRLIRWLAGKEKVEIKGAHVEIAFSIKGRTFEESAGTNNFPSGEIFTSPVEDSANGWVRFSYPAIYLGREVEDIELWFEDGKIVKEKAAKGQAYLTEILNTDQGSRYLGEWGIGTNYGIQRFTKNMLFDEKIGGTIHFAVGSGFPEAGSKNSSAVHWDMLCDMADSEILVDGELFYKHGKFVL